MKNFISQRVLVWCTGGNERRTLTAYCAVSGWGGYMLEKYDRPVGGSAGAQHKIWLNSGESASIVCHVTKNWRRSKSVYDVLFGYLKYFFCFEFHLHSFRNIADRSWIQTNQTCHLWENGFCVLEPLKHDNIQNTWSDERRHRWCHHTHTDLAGSCRAR